MSRIALIGENSVEYISILLDIWNGGDCAVLIDWRIPLETACSMMEEADVKRCYIQKELIANTIGQHHKDIVFIPFEITKNSAQLLPTNIRNKYKANNSMDEAVIIYSSGTTGRARGVILTHYAINNNATAINEYMKLGADDCLYIAKSLSHSSTLTGELLVALKFNIQLVIAPVIVPMRYIFDKINLFSVTTICLNPTLLMMFVTDFNLKKFPMPSLKTIYSSGSVLTDYLYEIVQKKITNIKVYNVYGLSEAGPRVAAQTLDCSNSNSVGKAINGVSVLIVDENGVCVPKGSRGYIHVKSKSLFKSYVQGSEKHKSLFMDWLNTGDIGYFDQDDELHVVGRVDDILIINSHKVYPVDIEKIIVNSFDVSECIVTKCVVDNKEILGCLYVSNFDYSNTFAKKLNKKLPSYEIPKFFIKVSFIPKNEFGKVSRTEIKKILETEYRMRSCK